VASKKMLAPKVLIVTDSEEKSSYLSSFISVRWFEEEAFLALSKLPKPKRYEHFDLSNADPSKGSLLSQLEGAIQSADTIFFDYGGLAMQQYSGGDRFIDHYNRFFIRMIKEKSSKQWICISAVQTFDQEEKAALSKLGVGFSW